MINATEYVYFPKHMLGKIRHLLHGIDVSIHLVSNLVDGAKGPTTNVLEYFIVGAMSRRVQSFASRPFQALVTGQAQNVMVGTHDETREWINENVIGNRGFCTLFR
jgi:hypothetical protein